MTQKAEYTMYIWSLLNDGAGHTYILFDEENDQGWMISLVQARANFCGLILIRSQYTQLNPTLIVTMLYVYLFYIVRGIFCP